MIPRHLIFGVATMLAVVLAMGFYVWRMRNRASQLERAGINLRAVAPPVAGPTEQVTLYVAYDDADVLRAQSSRIPLPEGRQQRAEELLRDLLGLYLDKNSPHPLGAGAEVRAVYLVDPGLVVIDVNSAFADGHRSGVLVEELTVVSMIQTLSANIPGIARVKILVNGETRDTLAGHADLSGFSDVAAVGQLAGQLQRGR
jgi:hypothetical protein